MSRPRAALVAGFVTAQGTDWWDDNQTFKAYNTGTGTYELRDDGHPGASEIRVRDYNGSDFFASCSSSRQYVTHTSTTWATDPYGLEEVSAVHHLGETVSFFKNTYDRDGMENTGGALLACVHGDAGYYQAAYDPTYNSIKLSQETAEEGPSAAAQDAVTHEFAHGIIEAECWAPTREPSPFGKRWPTFSVLGTAVRDASAKVS